MDNLYINTIRICIKANKISFGETLLFDIRSNHVYAVIIATDAGEASKKKITDKCKSFNVPYFVMMNKNDLNLLVNKDVSSIGIKDENLALKFIQNVNKGGVNYGK